MVDAYSARERLPAPLAGSGVRVWPVGSLLRAIADSLEARFNPVAVQGELSGFSRASSGHCYFSLKDDQGQVRCAMFRRASSLLDFSPRDGQLVELRGRLGVYEPRGELQLVVESMHQAGQGSLFEQFLQRKACLEAEGLFATARKRPLPVMPRAIGVVTSLGAAALHDVVSALQRRAPHIPVVLYPASVQGAQAASELRGALLKAAERQGTDRVDVLLLVRGGGAMEDLWAFNDELLARAIVASPMPVVCGVGHNRLHHCRLLRRCAGSNTHGGSRTVCATAVLMAGCTGSGFLAVAKRRGPADKVKQPAAGQGGCSRQPAFASDHAPACAAGRYRQKPGPCHATGTGAGKA